MPEREVAIFVGRTQELATLRGCLDRLEAGRGGIVTIFGQAGIGKTRLLAEARQTAGERVLWLEGRALSSRSAVSYWPFLEMIRGYAKITEDDDALESWAKLQRKLRALFGEEAGDILPYLATLLGLPVPGEFAPRVKYLDLRAMGRQLHLTTRRFFERLATQRPLALAFDDVQWMDAASADLLDHVLALVETVPLLVVAAGRLEPDSPAARLAAAVAPKFGPLASSMTLLPLPADAIGTLLTDASGGTIAPILRDRLVAEADGNPAAAEELLRAARRAADPSESIDLVAAVRIVRLERLERLDEKLHAALRLDTAIEDNVLPSLVGAVAEADRALDEYRTEVDFDFAERRRQLHRRVAECLEGLFTHRLDELSGLLAYHYAVAEEWQKATEYLLCAGDHAGQRAADREALLHYREALVAYERAFGDRWDRVQRASLERKMAEAYFRRGAHEEAIASFGRALRYLGHRPLPSTRWAIRWAIAREVVRLGGVLLRRAITREEAGPRTDAASNEAVTIYSQFGRIDYFLGGERFLLDTLLLLNEAERGDHRVGVCEASAYVGVVCDLLRAFGLAARFHRRAMEAAEELRQPLLFGLAFTTQGLHEYYLGQWDAALAHFQRAADRYREGGDLRGWATASQMTAWILRMQGKFQPSIDQSQAIVRVGQDAGDHQAVAWALHGMGWTQRHTGALGEAIEALLKSIDLYRTVPDHQAAAEALADLGQCYLQQGRLDDAAAALEESNGVIAERGLRGLHGTRPRVGLADLLLAVAERADETQRSAALARAGEACGAALRAARTDRGGLPAACRARGTLEWLLGHTTKARKWWLRSLAVAESLGAPFELGLTHLELGRHLENRAGLERAEALFSELGAAVELQRARTLLGAASAPAALPRAGDRSPR